jgi:hypothetical protein
MFIGIIVVMVLVAGLLQNPILNMRQENLITFAPPGELKHIVLFTQALGAFRSIVIDALWIRAMDLQNDKKFFELAQLYDLICEFEPHFYEIWIYSAWNMAYNISVELPNAEERWSWVQKGISLLRDKAIPLNPREADLYKELSWIYLHKIGDDLDNKHRYYKREMVLGLDRFFGAEQDIAGIKNAPDSQEELMKDKDIEQLAAKLAAEGKDPFKVNLMMPDAFNEKQSELLAAPENVKASKALLDYLRKNYLVRTLKLDPSIMLSINEKYGKLDWRLPEVHGLYWAELSIPLLKYDSSKSPLFYERYIYTAFQLMFRRGKIFIYYEIQKDASGKEKKVPTDVYFSPDVKWADKMDEVYLHLVSIFDEGAEKFSAQNARKNFLKRAVYFLYLYNEKEKSLDYYKKWVSAMMINNPDVAEVPFEDFILKEAKDNLASDGIFMNRANIKALIFLALGQREEGNEYEAAKFENLSKLLYDSYEKENVGYKDRFDIGTYEEIYQDALKDFKEQYDVREPENK